MPANRPRPSEERSGAPGEPRHTTVRFPGGLIVRFGWVGSGGAGPLFGVSQAGGSLADHGDLAASDPDAVCRAEVRTEGPGGTWTARLASPIYDEPQAVFWDVAGLLVVGYGLRTYAFDARNGSLRWSHGAGSPIVAVLVSSLLDHAIVQTEVETFALTAGGEAVWRLAHDDVVVAARLVAGQLVLTSYGGAAITLDPASGRPMG